VIERGRYEHPDHHSYLVKPECFPELQALEDLIRPYVSTYFYKELSDLKLAHVFLKHYQVSTEVTALALHVDDTWITVSLCIVGECVEGCEV